MMRLAKFLNPLAKGATWLWPIRSQGVSVEAKDGQVLSRKKSNLISLLLISGAALAFAAPIVSIAGILSEATALITIAAASTVIQTFAVALLRENDRD